MDDSTLASAFERLDAAHQLSGTVLVAQDRDVVLERAYGLASHQLDVPNTLDTKFAIASVTKMFTAMAALVLAEQGRIGLGERPAAYVPELARLDRGITLHHLLSHTAGLRDVYDVPELGYEVCNLRHDGGNLLEYLAAQPRLFPPGRGGITAALATCSWATFWSGQRGQHSTRC